MTDTNHIFFVTHGEGFPILFLHGNPVDHHFMLPLDPIFAKYEAIKRVYIDMPGFGESAGVGGIDSTNSIAEAVTDFASGYFRNEPFAVVGNSFGGMIARHLVAEFGEQIAGLALICPVVVAQHNHRRLPEKVVLEIDKEFLNELLPVDRAEFTRVEVRHTKEQWEIFSEYTLPGLRSYNRSSITQVRKDYNLSIEPEARFSTFDNPTLIITARLDNIVGYRDQFEILQSYPRATYVVLDSAGHNAHFDRPKEIAALFDEWLARML